MLDKDRRVFIVKRASLFHSEFVWDQFREAIMRKQHFLLDEIESLENGENDSKRKSK